MVECLENMVKKFEKKIKKLGCAVISFLEVGASIPSIRVWHRYKFGQVEFGQCFAR